MNHIKFYQVTEAYVDYLLPYAPHLFHNRQEKGKKARKYIGPVLRCGSIVYLAPLSSFKQKHRDMKDSLDFIKVKNYAVINLNNMFPVPSGQYRYVDISEEDDEKYRDLLRAEYRYIKTIQGRILHHAAVLYKLKLQGQPSSLAYRCNDFLQLEEACRRFAGASMTVRKPSCTPGQILRL